MDALIVFKHVTKKIIASDMTENRFKFQTRIQIFNRSDEKLWSSYSKNKICILLKYFKIRVKK